jgi:hypothetical protein
MAIAVTCSHCGVRLRFKDEHAGKTAKCRACEEPIVVQGQDIPDHDVFVSYSSKDANVANAVCTALEAKKLRCWIAPRDVLPGKAWAGAILDAISDTRLMVLIYSANANASPQVIREVDRAVMHNVIIIPFRIQNAAMSKEMEYYIGAAHWLDATDGATEDNVADLTATVRRLLGDPGSPAIKLGRKLDVAKTTAAPRRSVGWLIAAFILLLGVAGVWSFLEFRDRFAMIDGRAAGGSAQSVAATSPSTTPSAVLASAAVPTAPATEPTGPIDLLARVRLPEDAIGGTWTKTDLGFHGDRAGGDARTARLRLDYRPQGEYDFSMAFVRHDDGVAQVLAYHGTGFSWNIGRLSNAGFAFVDGIGFIKNRSSVRLTPIVESEKKHTSLVRVRKDSVSAYVDGRLVDQLKTDYSDLTIAGVDSVGAGYLGIVSYGPVDICSAEVIPYSAPATSQPSVVSKASSPIR